jgi:glyoxylase-like metal-dependent hydrolase (beta-lactamase superfamily II)
LRRPIHLACLVAASLATAFTVAGDTAQESAFRAEELAEGVTLFVPLGAGTNSLVVERGDGLLVVDAQPDPATARALLAAIGRRHTRPVRYLVLSHPHAEAAGGASAFPESTIVFASDGCRRALEDDTFDFGAEERARAPDTWVAPPRRLPTVVIRGRTDLADPVREVHLQVLARAHSRGDLMVFLPAANVLYTGGLLFHGAAPWAGDASVESWLATLNSIIRQAPRVVLGLHGPAIDAMAVQLQRDALAWVRGQVEEGFVDRLPPEGIAERVLALPELTERFPAADSRSFLPGLVRRVVEESLEHRRKRGLT